MEDPKDDDKESDSWIGPWDVVGLALVLLAIVKIIGAVKQCN